MSDEKANGARRHRPRATDAIVVSAVLVSDRSAPALCGVEPRVFRALVAKLGIPSTRIGKRLLCRATDLAEAIGRDDGGTRDTKIVAHVGARDATRGEILARLTGAAR